MKVLVTGGSGFIGSSLANKLSELGHEVYITGCDGEQKPKHIAKVDWEDFPNVDVIFHEAANNETLDKDEDAMFEANVEKPKRMFFKAFRRGCKKFVYASSTAVYGNSPAPYIEDFTPIAPLNPYGKSKAEFDKFAIKFAISTGTSVIGLRYCNIYGPGEDHKKKRASMVYQMFKQITSGNSPKLYKYGEQKRDWCYVDDVVNANLLAANLIGEKHNVSSNIFNIGSGESIPFNEVFSIINKELDKNLDIEYVDNEDSESYQSFTQCNITKAKLIGWKPQYDIRSGIKKYVKSLLIKYK